ncbi:hypothetical protein BTJ68_08364 [Hortaea werneckii EXF-2000]|uniref:Uncharacterized protein n=1 Tax=Hortaea werneckii EXF-2000 TaxID=1157616 RepID=A0A1Z5T5P6_HORWE|nr:hypothetical protein BTJ68_08364 [Hortaea werneckii EXF-2000]
MKSARPCYLSLGRLPRHRHRHPNVDVIPRRLYRQLHLGWHYSHSIDQFTICYNSSNLISGYQHLRFYDPNAGHRHLYQRHSRRKCRDWNTSNKLTYWLDLYNRRWIPYKLCHGFTYIDELGLQQHSAVVFVRRSVERRPVYH